MIEEQPEYNRSALKGLWVAQKVLLRKHQQWNTKSILANADVNGSNTLLHMYKLY